MTRNKYGVAAKHQRTVDGIVFDSRAEAFRYAELKFLERAGAITNLRLQVPFELVPAYTWRGKKVRASTYLADFVYLTTDGEEVVEDVKGAITQLYSLKKKLLLYRNPDLNFRELEARR